jgi:sugar/nucleoside kinase (ribokinase family)
MRVTVDAAATPDFVVIGHVVRDLAPEGWRPGGTVTFAAVQAHRLGRRVGIVTRAGGDVDVAGELPFASVAQAPSAETTTFENVYGQGRRTQCVRARGSAMTEADVPAAWRSAPAVLLGPVLDEVPAGMAEMFADGSLVGVSAQGWLRTVDPDGRVRPSPWSGEPFWRGCDVVFVSDEDLGDGQDGLLGTWTRESPVVAVTESWKGARVCSGGTWRRMEAFPEDEVDPTGAGDTFAAAFLIRLQETGEVDEAARFAAAAASISVGGIGASAVPWRDEIEARLRAYPEIVLR